MLRKIVIGLVAAVSLSAMALAATEASAKSFGGRGLGKAGGLGGHHFAGGRGFHGHRGFGGHGFGGMGLLDVGLGMVAIGIESACRPVVTANGRVVSAC